MWALPEPKKGLVAPVVQLPLTKTALVWVGVECWTGKGTGLWGMVSGADTDFLWPKTQG